MTSRSRTRLAWCAVGLGHLAPVVWLFGDALFRGRVLFFRDITYYYYPNLVFLATWIRRGVWPLWNPAADAGGPFLIMYPPDLLLAGVLGASGALHWGVALHLYVALMGGTLLGRRLGLGMWSSWLAGACYGLSGYVLSTVNLLPLLQASALAPWVVWAFLGLLRSPTLPRAVVLACVAALQLATLGVEVAAQTAFAGLVLAPLSAPLRGRLGLLAPRLGFAGLVFLLLSAPVLLGVRAASANTQRARGFTAEEALGYSAAPAVLAEAVLPRFLGDVHSPSNEGYWGQPFHPEGYPYLLSLYLGLGFCGFAAYAGRSRLWLLAVSGVLLSLGAKGPLGPLMGAFSIPFRAPVKLFLLTTLAIALLAGLGLERILSRRQPANGMLLAGLLPLSMAGALVWFPGASIATIARLLPEALAPAARSVLVHDWPRHLVTTGALCLASALALRLNAPWRPAAGLLCALDLLTVNGVLNPVTDARYYELEPEIRAAVTRAAATGPYRFFAYGLVNSPSAVTPRFIPSSDVWLYYIDRQTLLPRTPMIDGLDSAFDIDRTGLAPAGSTLAVGEISPLLFRQHFERLRLANVRFVLSFAPLPEDLVQLREGLRLDEVVPPLLLYEIRNPIPRAFWVARQDADVEAGALRSSRGKSSIEPSDRNGAPPGDAGAGRVSYARTDPHTIRFRVSGAPGYAVIVEGSHPDWRVEGPSGQVDLLAVNGRYWAVRFPGGQADYVARFSPRWRGAALKLLGTGLLLTAAALLFAWTGSRPRTLVAGLTPASSAR